MNYLTILKLSVDIRYEFVLSVDSDANSQKKNDLINFYGNIFVENELRS